MSAFTWLAIGFGVLLGLVGGAIGTYASIRNTNGPLERAFMVRISIITWIAVTLFVVAVMLIPTPYNYLLWIPYGVALVLAVRIWNRKQLELRALEGVSGTQPPGS